MDSKKSSLNSAADLFCGCGGLSLGLEKSGINVVFAADKWKEAVNCYNKNFKHKAIERDISDIDTVVGELKKKKTDIIVAGTPCQDFSPAGKREEGEKADLTVIFSKIIEKVKPKWFVLENVGRIIFSRSYKSARERFKKSGYGLTEVALNAKFYGVPQSRRRFFCVGRLGEDDGFMEKDFFGLSEIDELTVSDYFSKSKIETLDSYYYRHPRSYERKGIFSVDEPAPTVRGNNRPLPKTYQFHLNDAIKNKDGNVRKLTVMERAAIQTFPKNFKFDCATTAADVLVGNAVPPNLAKIVFGAIKIYGKMPNMIKGKGKRPQKKEIKGITWMLFVRWQVAKKKMDFEQAKDLWSLLTRALGDGEYPRNPKESAQFIENLKLAKILKKEQISKVIRAMKGMSYIDERIKNAKYSRLSIQ